MAKIVVMRDDQLVYSGPSQMVAVQMLVTPDKEPEDYYEQTKELPIASGVDAKVFKDQYDDWVMRITVHQDNLITEGNKVSFSIGLEAMYRLSRLCTHAEDRT